MEGRRETEWVTCSDSALGADKCRGEDCPQMKCRALRSSALHWEEPVPAPPPLMCPFGKSVRMNGGPSCQGP